MSIRDYMYKLVFEGASLKTLTSVCVKFPSVSRNYLLTIYRIAAYDRKKDIRVEYEIIMNSLN